jgi:PhnB protein
MSRVSTYLNFQGNTEEAFTFYSKVFDTEFLSPIQRFGDMGSAPGQPELPEHEKAMVLHVELPILAGHVIMATDMLESMGHELRVGNNTTINLEPDSREEADRLYAALSEGSSDGTGLNDMPWGAYWGSCLDQFGVRWMINVAAA